VEAAGHVGDAQVALARQGAPFSADASLDVGYRKGWNHGGITNLQMALAPVGLALPGKRFVLGPYHS